MTAAEQIKSRLDVVTFMQGYLKLDKAGVNFKARCPFHSEKTASFFVSPARDIWHCFGCSKGGDIFKFLMEMEGIDFPEALRILAERTGVELGRGDSQERSLRVKLLALLEDAADFYEKRLPQEKEVAAYLKERGLHDDTIKTFRIGFAPKSWQETSEYLKSKGYTDVEIEKAGLTIQGNRGPYDRFRSRIMFPLEDQLGRVIGFGGRIFGESEGESAGAKYINTPQTALYDKSKYLYALGKAKAQIHEKKNTVLVEGYFDCILSHQAGVKNTVAVSGTALTEAHLYALARLSDSLVFAFDVDKAGIEASRRAASLAHAKDFTVHIVDIEGGKDPADIAARDSGLWQKMVSGAQESIEFFLKKAAASHAADDPVAKKKIGEEILPMVGRLSNEIERAHWVKKLAVILRVGEDAVWRELEKYKGAGKGSIEPKEVLAALPQLTRKARLEERILGMVLLEPKFLILGDLPGKQDASLLATGELFELLQKSGIHGKVTEFFATLPEDLRREAERYLFEAEIFISDAEHREEDFLHMLHAWRELSLKEKLQELHEEIKRLEALGKKEETQVYMRKFQELAQHLSDVVLLHHNADDKKEKKENY